MLRKASSIKTIKLPLILLFVLLIPLFFGSIVPLEIKSFFYAISLTMKCILILITPLIIFSFLFSSLLSLKTNIIKFVVILISAVFISNFIAICTGFAISFTALPKLQLPIQNSFNDPTQLKPLWEFCISKLIPTEFALIGGFLFGIFFSLKKSSVAEKIAEKLNEISTGFLKRIFVPLLPLFILGFVFKLEADQVLLKSLKVYSPVFFVIVGTQICYIILLYMIASNFSLKRFFTYIRNVFPATITGFSTISSMATMPMLIIATEKNLNNPTIAKTIIPATINIHTIGSALGLIILSYATLLTFDYQLPTSSALLKFAFYYALAKFAVVAVPGGVLIIMCPLLEKYLGFTGEMTGLITAVYMLLDPFGTAVNVTGNGAFAIIFSKIYKPSSKKKQFALFESQKI
ncbi:cation:dicarboxylase symporter family transporter [Holosporaceae bacterium 'Namur']|nr:cation:dicarboxylase symporter family transporter [Holosporaceae bacterium 'Namur']